jgi:hypothetical protein
MMGGDEIDINRPNPGQKRAVSSTIDGSTNQFNKQKSSFHSLHKSREHKWSSGSAGTKLDMKPIKHEEHSRSDHMQHNLHGGRGSAWRASAYSVGPVNYPNNGWSNGKQQFNQFTNDGVYIKNTDLPYAAAPISTGVVKDQNPITGELSDWIAPYASVGGKKKKKKASVKKKKSKYSVKGFLKTH